MPKIKLLILTNLTINLTVAMDRPTPNSRTPRASATPTGMMLPISSPAIMGDGFEEDSKSAPMAQTTELADNYSKEHQLQIITGETTADVARFFFAASPSLELDPEVFASFTSRLSPDNLGNADGLQKQLIAARIKARTELQEIRDFIEQADLNGTGEIARASTKKRIKQLRQILS